MTGWAWICSCGSRATVLQGKEKLARFIGEAHAKRYGAKHVVAYFEEEVYEPPPPPPPPPTPEPVLPRLKVEGPRVRLGPREVLAYAFHYGTLMGIPDEGWFMAEDGDSIILMRIDPEDTDAADAIGSVLRPAMRYESKRKRAEAAKADPAAVAFRTVVG